MATVEGGRALAAAVQSITTLIWSTGGNEIIASVFDFFANMSLLYHGSTFSHSMALNFDEYTKGWEYIGTSLPSDARDARDK